MAAPAPDNPVKRKTLILAMSDFLRKTPKHYNKLLPLAGKPVMPIAARFEMEETTNLRALDKASWYFADRHHYYKSFSSIETVLFAAFPVDQYWRLQPLNVAIVKAYHTEHCLSNLVAEDKDPGSNRVLSIAATELLRSKVKYVRRYVEQTL